MHVSIFNLIFLAVLAALGSYRVGAYVAYRLRRTHVEAARCECRVCGNHEVHCVESGLAFEDLECMKCENPTCDILDDAEVFEGFA